MTLGAIAALPDAGSGTACQVAAACGLPITTVAAQAGCYDQAHLTRHFKRIAGLPPGRYLTDGIT